VLVSTTDRFADLRPGDQGVVRRFDPERQLVYIDWDRGGSLSMCLDAGDELRTVRISELAEPDKRAGTATPNPRVSAPSGLAASVGAPPPSVCLAGEAAAAALWSADRSALDSEDVDSLFWIIDHVGRCTAMERIEGNLSTIGRVIGVTSHDGSDLRESAGIRAASLQVRLEPSGDRVLWTVTDLISAHQNECLFEVG
jgi:hypothetical protein